MHVCMHIWKHACMHSPCVYVCLFVSLVNGWDRDTTIKRLTSVQKYFLSREVLRPVLSQGLNCTFMYLHHKVEGWGGDFLFKKNSWILGWCRQRILLGCSFLSPTSTGPSFARTRSRTQNPLQLSALAALEAEARSVQVDKERLSQLLSTVVAHTKGFTVERLQHLYSVLSCAIYNHRHHFDKTQLVQVRVGLSRLGVGIQMCGLVSSRTVGSYSMQVVESDWGVGIAQWLVHRTRDKILGLSHENFLLQGQFSVPSLILVFVTPLCYHSERSQSFSPKVQVAGYS